MYLFSKTLLLMPPTMMFYFGCIFNTCVVQFSSILCKVFIAGWNIKLARCSCHRVEYTGILLCFVTYHMIYRLWNVT